jgi:hypothetical protein
VAFKGSQLGWLGSADGNGARMSVTNWPEMRLQPPQADFQRFARKFQVPVFET